jgi:YfiH family protein
MLILSRSSLKIKKDLPYFEDPEMARIEWVRHAFLTRKGGVSLPPYHSLNIGERNGDREEHVFRNRNLIAQAFCFDLERLISLHQKQEDKILVLKEPVNALPPLMEYDAMVTNSPNIFLGILTADCLPIFAVDKKKKVVAAVHAGRQGTALHITAKVLRNMKEEFNCSPKDLVISLGPSIGPCCYEIDEKVFQTEWEPFSTSKGNGRRMVDLAAINVAQMKKEGIQEEQICRIDLCTRCHHDLLFSYRREGQTGRQLSFIGII